MKKWIQTSHESRPKVTKFSLSKAGNRVDFRARPAEWWSGLDSKFDGLLGCTFSSDVLGSWVELGLFHGKVFECHEKTGDVWMFEHHNSV